MTYEHKVSLDSLVRQGLVSKRKHPEHDLWVYNYTPKAVTVPWHEWGCDDGKDRDYKALPDARGLILDSEYNIIGRGFRKFWNYEQVKDSIPWDENAFPEVKYDGSLIIVCWYKDNLIVATRGSFESEQALWAQQWIKTHKTQLPATGCSFLYEAIYPENKVVVDYGRTQDLVPLAEISNISGADSLSWIQFRNRWRPNPTDCLGKISESTIKFWKDKNIKNEEGWVFVFHPSCFRVKIKFDDYVKLHRIRFQTTTHSIWEMLKDSNSNSFIPLYELVHGLPDELAKKIKQYAFGLSAQVADLHIWVRKKREKIQSFQNNDWSEKAIAEWIKGQKHPHVLFALWRGKSKVVEELIWKAIEPKKEPLV